jgi:hypothetical protein
VISTQKRTCGRFNEKREGTSLKQTACKVHASWMVGVVFIDKNKIEETTIWVPTMYVCNRHRMKLRVEDVVTEQGWQRMNYSLREQGHLPPKRSLTKLAFKTTKVYPE